MHNIPYAYDSSIPVVFKEDTQAHTNAVHANAYVLN